LVFEKNILPFWR